MMQTPKCCSWDPCSGDEPFSKLTFTSGASANGEWGYFVDPPSDVMLFPLGLPPAQRGLPSVSVGSAWRWWNKETPPEVSSAHSSLQRDFFSFTLEGTQMTLGWMTWTPNTFGFWKTLYQYFSSFSLKNVNVSHCQLRYQGTWFGLLKRNQGK